MSGTGHDMLAGGLFEDGSLFDEAPPTLPPSERVPESNYDDGDNFGAPSPSHSSLQATEAPVYQETLLVREEIKGGLLKTLDFENNGFDILHEV